MITLCFIAYVIISLFIARYKYWDSQIDRYRGQVNPCFRNMKKSLKYGFLFIPIFTISCYAIIMVLIGLGKAFIFTITWILTNMP